MSTTRAKIGFHIALIGMLFNILIFLMKLLVGLISGSIAVTTDAIGNLLDASSSFLAVIGFRLSVRRGDENHPHGHGRTEYLVGFVISLIICATAVIFGYISVKQIILPTPIETSPFLVAIISIAIIGKVGLAFFYNYFNRELNSPIFHAAARDSLGDALSSSTTILALILAPITSFPVDGIIGLAIAGFILYMGLRTMSENIHLILGTALAEKDLDQIRAYILGKYAFTSIRDLDYHDYGPANRELIIKVDLNPRARPKTIERDLTAVKAHLARKFHIKATLYWPPTLQ